MATKAEMLACLEFVAKPKSSVGVKTVRNVAEKLEMPSGDSGIRARENLIMVLFNHNDFVTIR